LDFETFFPVVPIYPRTRPYQQLPFQWSLHVQDQKGRLTHYEFLATGAEDPREEFTHTLVAALSQHPYPITVYSPFEKRVLTDLLDAVSRQRRQIKSILRRLVDLLPLVRRHVYHPHFDGSFSIKAVGPVLGSEISYDDLEIAEGSLASSTFERLVSGKLLPGETASGLRRALLAYCKRDTLALVEVHRALLKQATSGSAHTTKM
jgi:predicted RecB family nuclease